MNGASADDGASEMSEVPAVVNNAVKGRFETTVDGARAELIYHRDGRRLVLVHTGVPDELAGRGIGGILVRAAVDEAARHDLTIVPECPFAQSWLRKHPDAAGRAALDGPDDGPR
jgi:hypothetical protein